MNSLLLFFLIRQSPILAGGSIYQNDQPGGRILCLEIIHTPTWFF